MFCRLRWQSILPSCSQQAVLHVTRRNIFNLHSTPGVRFQLRRKVAETLANNFKFDRVAAIGPELSCLEWLMNCGAPLVKMSDGTEIRSQKQMRQYLALHGVAGGKLNAPPEPMKPLTQKEMDSLLRSDSAFANRWIHIPEVYVKEVDASDSVIADPGFRYFAECRMLEKLKMNCCDYFTDSALQELASGRASKTLKDIEIVLNPAVSDMMVRWLIQLKALRRVHFYFLPYVSNRLAVIKRIRTALPFCEVNFPAIDRPGYGYDEAERERQLRRMERKDRD